MRILFLTHDFPYPPVGGGRLRVYYLLRELARHHEVTLLGFAQEADLEHLEALREMGIREANFLAFPQLERESGWRQLKYAHPNIVRSYHSAALLESLRNLARADRFDVLHVEELVMAPYVLALNPPIPRLVDRQKIDYQFYWSLWKRPEANSKLRSRVLGLLEWVKLYRLERRVARFYRFHVVLSQEDAAFIRSLNPDAIPCIVPNGVDVDYFAFAPLAEAEARTITFIGSMDYQPNVDAIHFFMEEIYPLLKAAVGELKVYIVGRQPAEAVLKYNGLDGVVVTGEVPDIRPYLSRSVASFVPMRIGGGIRNKILESMSAGRPVVSTTIGAEGIACRQGEHLLIADDPASFAGRLAELMNDAPLRERLARNGRSLVEERYAWPEVTRSLVDAYQRARAG